MASLKPPDGTFETVGLEALDDRVDLIQEAPLNVQDSRFGASPSNTAAANDVAFGLAYAALPANGGEIYIPPGLYSTSSPLLAGKNGVTYKGDNQQTTIINNNVTDVCTPSITSSSVNYFRLENLRLAGGSGGGHVIAPLGGVSKMTINNCRLDTSSTSKRVWHQPSTIGSFLDSSIIDTHMGVPSTSTVTAFSVISSGGLANANRIERCVMDGADVEPFFQIEEVAAATYCYQWTFRDLTFEVCRGGLIHGYSAHRWVIENIGNYDMQNRGASTGHAILFGKSTAGPISVYNRIGNYARQAGVLGAFSDIQLVTSETGRTTIWSSDQATLGAGCVIDLGSEAGTTLIDVPRSCTVNNVHTSLVGFRPGAGSTITSKGVIQFGSNVQVYDTTFPATGTWADGDIVWNTAPAAAGVPGWVCTTPGTPGTWKAMAALAA